MNNSLEQLRGLLHIHARAAGHTVAAVKIATEINGVLVVADAHQSRCEPIASAVHHHNLKVATLTEVAWPRAAGLNHPIVVDHYALLQLLSGIDNAVRAMEMQICELKSRPAINKRTMQLICSAFLPTNPNKLRKADPDVVTAAKEFIAAAK